MQHNATEVKMKRMNENKIKSRSGGYHEDDSDSDQRGVAVMLESK